VRAQLANRQMKRLGNFFFIARVKKGDKNHASQQQRGVFLNAFALSSHMDYPEPNCTSSNKINTTSEELEIQVLKNFLLLLLEVINILFFEEEKFIEASFIFFVCLLFCCLSQLS
jgi:hypothetical protein